MNILGFGKKEKSIDELEEETENLEAENRKADQEVSLQKKALIIAQLKKRGLELGHFEGGTVNEKLSRAWAWLKTH